MIKPQKNAPKVSLKDLQQDRTELDRVKKSPVAYYNMYVRREGEPILSEKEYTKMMIEKYNKRKREAGEVGFIFVDDTDTPDVVNSIINKNIDKDAIT